MRVVVDMNLSTQWAIVLNSAGHDAVHWTNVGNPNASDHEIFEFALKSNYIVLTQDLDFSAILAHTGLSGPSVIQLRLIDSPPTSCSRLVLAAIDAATTELNSGAILTIDPIRSKVRVLPIGGDE